MKIQFLYFDDCPSYQTALVLLQDVLGALGRSDPIETIEIKTEADVQQWKFIGSPTIRINGVDLFDQDASNYGMECRVYMTPDGLKGCPTREMLVEVLKENDKMTR